MGCVICKQTLALQTDLFEIAWTAYFDASLLKTSYSVRVHKYWPEALFREFPIWENNVWTHHYIILMDLLEQQRVWAQIRVVVLTNKAHMDHQPVECSSSVVYLQLVPRNPPEWGKNYLYHLPRRVWEHLTQVRDQGFIRWAYRDNEILEQQIAYWIGKGPQGKPWNVQNTCYTDSWQTKYMVPLSLHS